MKKTFKIEELCCANCAAKIEEKIKKLDCIKDAHLAFMAERLTIEVDENDLEAAIAEIRKIIKKVEPDCRLITD